MSAINNGYELQEEMRENLLLAESKKDLGNEEYKFKNYTTAIKYYSDAITLCPNVPAFYGNRSACYMMLGDYKQAQNDAKSAVDLDPSFENGFIRIAKCSLMLGDLVGLEQAAKSLLNLNPKSTALNIEIQSMLQLRDLESKSVMSYDKRDFRTTIYHMDSALKIAPSCHRYMLMKAESLALLGHLEEASGIALKVMKSDKKSAEGAFIRGLCLYYMGNLEKCIILFHQTLSHNPDHQKGKMYRMTALNLKSCKDCGDELLKAGRLEDAYAAYSKALQIDMSNNNINSKLYYSRALAAYDLKLKRDCARECSSALSIKDDYVEALLLRAKSYFDLEEFEESIKDYENAYKFDKTSQTKTLLREAKMALQKPKTNCYYKTLGISRNATDDEIKTAYRKRALIHHPDRHILLMDDEKQEQAKKFTEVGQAYTVLSDPQKKARYDNGQDLGKCETNFDATEAFHRFFFSENEGTLQKDFCT